MGRYVLSADIWPLLAKTPPGAGDEIQLTDAIDMLIEKETVEAYHMKGRAMTAVISLGYMQAFVEYGIRHKTLGTDFKAWLKKRWALRSNIRIGVFHETVLSNATPFFYSLFLLN